jgi:hypothetical protein
MVAHVIPDVIPRVEWVVERGINQPALGRVVVEAIP